MIALRGRGVAAHRCETAPGGGPGGVGADPGVALVDLDLGPARTAAVSGVDLVPVLLGRGWRVVILTGSAPEADIAEPSPPVPRLGPQVAPFAELLDTVLAPSRAGRARRVGADALGPTAPRRACTARPAASAGTSDRPGAAGARRARRRQARAAIAEDSVVSLATVRAQIRAILTKLGVSSQLEAVALLRELGGD